MRSLILAVGLLGMACAAPASAANAPSALEKALSDRVDRSVSKAEQVASLAGKLSAVADLQKFLESEEEELKAKKPLPPRDYRFSLHGLRIYVGLIDTQGFSPAKCPRYRDRIRFHASPRSEESEPLPGEAKVALKLVDALCGKAK